MQNLNIENLDLNTINAASADLQAELESLKAIEAEEEKAKAKKRPARKKAEAEATVEVEAIEDEAVVIAHIPGELKDMVANVSAETVSLKQAEVIAAFERLCCNVLNTVFVARRASDLSED